MSGYPIILCGDHAEFEAEWAKSGKPDNERPDWPLPSFDAKDWAEAFCKIANEHGIKDAEGKPVDEGWMTSWFANALMRGHDEHASKVEVPCRYDWQRDEMVPVTQEWVNWVQDVIRSFGSAREQARRSIGLVDGIVVMPDPRLQEFVNAWKPEFDVVGESNKR